MTTSNDYSFTASRDDIINYAALLVNAISDGITMPSGMTTSFAFTLNAMVAQWAASGLHVWTETEGVLFPQPSQVKYGAGTGATDNITASYNQTTASAAAALGATALSVASTSNILTNDNIGVVLDSGTVQWTTVSGIGTGSITLGAALTDSVSTGAWVWNYTSRITRPLKVLAYRRHDVSSGIDTPLVPPISRLDYQALPDKTGTGNINQVFYDPQLGTGYFYLWQPLATVDTLLKFTWQRPIQDFLTSSDNPDLPAEWINPLIYNLALLKCPEFSVPQAKMDQIKLLADQFKAEVEGWDREAEAIYFGFDSGP